MRSLLRLIRSATPKSSPRGEMRASRGSARALTTTAGLAMVCAVTLLIVLQGASAADKKKKKKAVRLLDGVQAAAGPAAACGADLGPRCGLGAPTPVIFGCPGVCPGDFNGDGLIDEIDVMIFDQTFYEAFAADQFCLDVWRGVNDPVFPAVINECDRRYLVECLLPKGSCNPNLWATSIPGPGGLPVPNPFPAAGISPTCGELVIQANPNCATNWNAGCNQLAQAACAYYFPSTEPFEPRVGDCICPHYYDTLTPNCDSVHNYPFCNDRECAETVCARPGFQYCCTDFWDTGCVQEARLVCQQACSSPELERLVCNDLPYCCSRDGSFGNCFDPLPGQIGCQIAPVAALICSNPAFASCCTQAWDADCAAYAKDVAPGVWYQECADRAFGYALGGPGLQSFTAYSFDCTSCPSIGGQQPCDQTTLSGIDFRSRVFALNSRYPGNPNFYNGDIQECRERLLRFYPFCLDPNTPSGLALNWTDPCTEIAKRLCQVPQSGNVGPTALDFLPTAFLDNCLTVSETPGCADTACADLVCEVLPACCTIKWDVECVELASVACSVSPAFWTGDTDALGVGGTPSSQEVRDGCGDPAAGSCCYESFSPFCRDSVCCALVCSYDSYCCEVRWDESCAIQANAGCELNGVTDCFIEHPSGGCTNLKCADEVCASLPACCNVEWDAVCVSRAQLLATIPNSPCANGPVVRDFCACGPKPLVAGFVGGPGSVVSRKDVYSCFNARSIWPTPAQFLPGCDDPVCCNSVCYLDTYCCEIEWDQLCADAADALCDRGLFPTCGKPTSGFCYLPNGTPGCDNATCCTAVCLIDPDCCDIAWDEDCVVLATENCTQCGDTLAGSCFNPNPSPACDDEDCCVAVCDVDGFCCSVAWDGACVGIASSLTECKPLSGCGVTEEGTPGRSCYVANLEPGCGDQSCCEDICEGYDSFCCSVRWDAVCAAQAFSFCSGATVVVTDEPCTTPHRGKGCNDTACATTVCSIPAYENCCDIRWDAECVRVAQAVCIGLYQCPAEGDCFTEREEPGCDDPSCCEATCLFDPLCCIESWSSACADLAADICETPIPTPSGRTWNCPCLGSCFEPNTDPTKPRPGCDDESCCNAVCGLDEACCTVDWDADCASLASEYCSGTPACGEVAAGSCLIPSETPFCDDAVCCTAVCAEDPLCCAGRWDSFCVATAIERCQRGCGIESSGSCFYPHLTPGCSDAECCSDICELDPICCTIIWDGTCATEALDLCDPPECGDFPAGNCCEINFSPSCNDAECCDAVCAIDPVCCDTTWDIECVREAQRSTSCNCGADWDCGDPCAGDCCIPNGTPKCDDADCCDSVCADDAFCCEQDWDLTCANMALEDEECNAEPTDPCPLPQCGDPGTGDCCFANGTPSCDDQTCCDLVCNDDPVCCDVAWDLICAQEAADNCDICDSDLECGSPDSGLCSEPNPTPFCSDQDCCETVCGIEPFCCIGAWDDFCVSLNDLFCTP